MTSRKDKWVWVWLAVLIGLLCIESKLMGL